MFKRMVTFLIISLILPAAALHPVEKLEPARLHGTWRLLYRGGYGYTFKFQKNFQSVCIIHLNTSAVVFKGVYTIENENAVRINIYEMKNDCNAQSPSTGAGFTRTSSTYFVFRASLSGVTPPPVLMLYPSRTVIDGRSSDGYFEPEIRLTRTR